MNQNKVDWLYKGMTNNKKYEFLKNDYIDLPGGNKVYRIKALCDFGEVKAEEIGGYVESESNLSHDDNAWVSGDAWVGDKMKMLKITHVDNETIGKNGVNKIRLRDEYLGDRTAIWYDVYKSDSLYRSFNAGYVREPGYC